MDEAVKRIVDKKFPELTAGHHLPRYAKIVSNRETPKQGDVADKFRPRYAVDVQVLDDHGKPDKAYPIIKDVPLPVQSVGHESGSFSFPEDGTKTVLHFANGSPNSPFISQVLPNDKSLPTIERGETLVQHSATSFTKIDKDGSHHLVTDQAINQQSTDRGITAVSNAESFTQSTRNIEADDNTTVGGSKSQKVFGNYQVLVGGRLELGSIAGIVQTSTTMQSYKAPQTWIGSESENVLGLLSELKAQFISMCNILASHTHGGVAAGAATTASPTQAGNINSVGTQVNAIKARLDSMKI